MNQIQTTNRPINLRLKDLFQMDEAVKKLSDTMTKQKQEAFKTSLLSIVSSNTFAWNKVEPVSIFSSALIAGTLDLAINPNFGYAYIIPYGNQAQFQIGWKGLMQLAIRSGEYHTINASEVKEGEIENFDRLSGEITFNWIQDESRITVKTIGYVAYFKLKSGFSKMLYITKEEAEAHAKKYSQSYKSNSQKMNIWRDDFDTMAKKTVLKALIGKYGIPSVEMQKAVEFDQAVVDNNSIQYIDNQDSTDIEVEIKSELQKYIENEVETLESLKAVEKQLKTEEEKNAWSLKHEQLTAKTVEASDTDSEELFEDNKPATKI